jgi:DNA polymerase-3 subunit beta
MRFNASSSDLIPAFQLVSKAVSPKSSMQVLTGIFMSWENNTLQLVATDLELGIEAFVDIKSDGSGKAVVPEKYITEIVRRAPTENVEFSFDSESKSINIVSGHASFTIKTLDPTDFPLFHRLEKGEAFSINESVLKRLIRYTSFAAATSDSRRFLTGCYATFNSEGMTFVGTNAYRLARMTAKTDIEVDHEVSAIIPAKTLNHLERFLEDSEDAVVVTVDDRQVMFQKGNTTFVSRLIDGSYPDYKRIIPSAFETEVVVERDVLFHSIERAALFVGDDSSGVRMEILEGSVEISSRATEVGSLSDKVPAEKSGEDLRVVLRWEYLTDVLRLLKDESIRIRFAGKVKPICLQEQTDEYDFLYLIMPFNVES